MFGGLRQLAVGFGLTPPPASEYCEIAKCTEIDFLNHTLSLAGMGFGREAREASALGNEPSICRYACMVRRVLISHFRLL